MEWSSEFPEAILDHGILYPGTKALLYGKYKSMKSMLLQNFVLSVANGDPWLGIATPREGASVLYLQLEIPHKLLQRRTEVMSKGRWKQKQPTWWWTEHYLKLDTPGGLARVEKAINHLKPAVLVIDPLYKVISGNLSEQSDVQPTLDALDVLIGNYGIAVVIASHTRKPTAGDKDWGSDDLTGTAILSAWADSVIKVERKDGGLCVNFDVIRHAEDDIRPVNVMIDKALTFPRKEVLI